MLIDRDVLVRYGNEASNGQDNEYKFLDGALPGAYFLQCWLSVATLAAAQGASAFLPDGSTLTQGSNFTVTVQQPHFGGGVVAQRSLTIGLTFGGAGPELFSGSFDPESSPDGTQDFVLTAPDNIGTGSAIIQLGAAEEEDSPGEFEDFFNIITLDVELE